MYFAIAFALSGLAIVRAQSPVVPGVTGVLGDAPIVQGNPVGVTYTAVLPNSGTTNIRGYISATANANGTGVNFDVNFSGFPSASLGPFQYHIHDQPVPTSGNCTATLAHLDSFIRGEQPPCDSSQPQTCQVGDLSGKHGNIATSPFQDSYYDLYLATRQGPGAFFGNRSVVVHTSNSSRLTCANFTLTSYSTSNGSNVTTGTSPPPVPFTGGAASNLAGATAVIGVFLLALTFFL